MTPRTHLGEERVVRNQPVPVSLDQPLHIIRPKPSHRQRVPAERERARRALFLARQDIVRGAAPC